jgi:formate dehydrogenase iron-sulfur subunit
MSVGLLFDATECIGCGACADACKQENHLPLPVEPHTTAYTWTTVTPRAGVHVRSLCMHCLEPTCVSVCPVGALQKTAAGPVVYDAARCIGCRYCIMACPFGVPKYQWDRAVPVVGKCTMCADKVASGEPTACAAICPTGATKFGDREALLAEARSRIRDDPGKYVDHVYGVDEAGGTSVLMLSSVPFEELGLPTNVPRQPLPLLTWQVLSKVPDFVALAAAMLYGVFWITRRREEVAAARVAAHGGRR